MIAGSARVSALQKPARGGGPLTCPFSKPRADAGLVAHAPHLEGPEERVRGAQGQVGHGARAHPVQETRGRESALHGWRLGLTTTVNGEEKKKTNEWSEEAVPAVTPRTPLTDALLGPKARPQRHIHVSIGGFTVL